MAIGTTLTAPWKWKAFRKALAAELLSRRAGTGRAGRCNVECQGRRGVMTRFFSWFLIGAFGGCTDGGRDAPARIPFTCSSSLIRVSHGLLVACGCVDFSEIERHVFCLRVPLL